MEYVPGFQPWLARFIAEVAMMIGIDAIMSLQDVCELKGKSTLVSHLCLFSENEAV